MILVKPDIAHISFCRACSIRIKPERLLWQGIHVCVVAVCPSCGHEIIDDLPVGHALYSPCRVDATTGLLLSESGSENSWFSLPFARSIRNPETTNNITLSVEIFKTCRQVVVLNCLDFLYGHALLKLLNAERHLVDSLDLGLVLIIPQFLRWMVPAGVAEIWTANISLTNALCFYPMFDRLINKECERFEEIYVSRAFSHPQKYNISRFTGTEKHDFAKDDFRITFIWREDRLWQNGSVWEHVSRRIGFIRSFILYLQNWKVISLFSGLRARFPRSTFTIAGLGTNTRFPSWIDDRRVNSYANDTIERHLCKVYAESRLVIGVHGSNMLLPSGHAGMTLDLMPLNRWGNFAQDISYQEEDPRLAAYRYKCMPISTDSKSIVNIITEMISGFNYFKMQMLNILPELPPT